MPRKKKETEIQRLPSQDNIEDIPFVESAESYDGNLDELIAAMRQRIIYLEKELNYYKAPALEGSLVALNYQLNKINEMILGANIRLDGNDKQFERFWKFMTEIQTIHVTINNLQNMLFPKTAEEVKDEVNSTNIMEKLAGVK